MVWKGFIRAIYEEIPIGNVILYKEDSYEKWLKTLQNYLIDLGTTLKQISIKKELGLYDAGSNR